MVKNEDLKQNEEIIEQLKVTNQMQSNKIVKMTNQAIEKEDQHM